MLEQKIRVFVSKTSLLHLIRRQVNCPAAVGARYRRSRRNFYFFAGHRILGILLTDEFNYQFFFLSFSFHLEL